MNQAIMKAEAENGEIKDWILDCGASFAPTCTADDVLNWYNLYLKKHINSLAVKKADPPSNGVVIYFADGSVLYISTHLYDMNFYINERAYSDANYARPGINKFSFRLNPKVLEAQEDHYNQGALEHSISSTFEPYAFNWDGTREGLIEGKKNALYGCNKTSTNRAYCAKLIQYDGWEIKEDYPW